MSQDQEAIDLAKQMQAALDELTAFISGGAPDTEKEAVAARINIMSDQLFELVRPSA